MFDVDYDQESQGRLMLWRMAIIQCQKLLELARRAEKEMFSPEVDEKEKRYRQAAREYAEAQPDYISGEWNRHFDAFKKQQQREFGAYIDCGDVKNYCRMLAIVFFCQIFNKGHSASGAVAANNDDFRKNYLNSVIDKVFNSQDEKQRFDDLCKLLRNARNEMIGHADGEKFEIKHPTATLPVRSANDFRIALEGIDFSYWQSILEPMLLAL